MVVVSLPLHQFDYIFAIGIIFAFLDAYGIGANDVANSFATSVSSRSLTLLQACCIATVTELLGAVLVGSRVADTVRNKIISVKDFEKEPTVLMLGMMCALIASSTWLLVATRMGFPVSTTHSIIGGIIGVGIAAKGSKGVSWSWKKKGVTQVVASWFIAPAVAGGFAAVIFLFTKFGVLKRKNSLFWGMVTIPFYFALTSGILTMLIVWKGAPTIKADKLNTAKTLGSILGVAFGLAFFCTVFFLPWLHRKLVKEDLTIRWYHIFLGPALLFRGEVPPPTEEVQVVQDYYRGHKTAEELAAAMESGPDDLENNKEASPNGDETLKGVTQGAALEQAENESNLPWFMRKREGPWILPRNLAAIVCKGLLRGVLVDVVKEQTTRKSVLAGNIEKTHTYSEHFENKTEYLFSFLQVLTAGTASFAHGSNDVANAMGPLSTIYFVWKKNSAQAKSDVPIWVLIFGGFSIDIGLWTYGYNIMRNLGNRVTLMSPSRGFTMELGAAVTVVMATRLSLPISTTQCISGATVAVGLCTGDFRSVNWRMVAWIYLGWLVTLPITGIVSGCLMGIIINAPRFGKAL